MIRSILALMVMVAIIVVAVMFTENVYNKYIGKGFK